MKIEKKGKFVYEIVMVSFKLIMAGLVIGLFHKYDFWITILLICFMIWKLFPKVFKNFNQNLILFYGMLLTGLLGISAEYWGVSNGYWTYHDLSGGREFPYWLFFSWMLAFYFLYKLECRLIVYLKPKNLKTKVILAIFVSMIFPVLGEIITINLGVWTYDWPMKFLGVPLYAVLALIVLHMFVNFILVIVCKKLNIQDPIFTLNSISK